MVDLWRVLADPAFLKRAGFLNFTAVDANERAAMAVEDDYLARLLGTLVLSLVGGRQVRSLWLLHSWPLRFCSLVGTGDHVGQSMVEHFRDDHAIWQRASAVVGRPAGLTKMLTRSLFDTVPVKQFHACLAETEWTVTPALKDLARSKIAGLCSSQTVEDEFGETKAALECDATRKQLEQIGSLEVRSLQFDNQTRFIERGRWKKYNGLP